MTEKTFITKNFGKRLAGLYKQRKLASKLSVHPVYILYKQFAMRLAQSGIKSN